MEPGDMRRKQQFEAHLRQFAAMMGNSDRLADALSWVAEDFGLSGDPHGTRSVVSSILFRDIVAPGQWAWRWNAWTAGGMKVCMALLCDGEALGITAGHDGSDIPAVRAVADLDYDPERDYDGTADAYTLVRPVLPQQECSRAVARFALSDVLDQAINADSCVIPNTITFDL